MRPSGNAAILVLGALFLVGVLISRLFLKMGLCLPVARCATVAVLLLFIGLLLTWLLKQGGKS